MSQYAIVIEGDGSTNYSAYAPDLPGVVATGDHPGRVRSRDTRGHRVSNRGSAAIW